MFIIEDENEGKNFIMGKDFMRFRFYDFMINTNDNLVYNQKINVPVCVMSIGTVSERTVSVLPTD